MKRLYLLCYLLLITLVSGANAEVKPDKALCPVCAVHGETDPEEVKAQAEYDGKAYYFCSDKCREAFQEDPLAYLPLELPRPAPGFVVETLSGEDFDATDMWGMVVLVDFWATWCKPCVKAMPKVQELYDRYKDRGFTVAGISIDEDENRKTKVENFLRKHEISYPVFLDTKDSPAWYPYGVKAVPAMFLIDRDGDIVAQWTGTVDHEQLEAEVARLVDTVSTD